MKKTFISLSMALVIAPSLFLLNSCSMGGGTYSDVTNGVNYSYKGGLSIGGYGFYNGDKKLSRNEIPYGNEMVFTLSNTEGFKEKMGKVFLQAAMKIKDGNGKILFENADLFKAQNESGGLDAQAVKDALSLTITLQSPVKINNEYVADFTIKDKNGKGEIAGSFKFKTVNVPGTTYAENGIFSDGPIFVTQPDYKSLSDNNLGKPEKLVCYFTNMSGMVSENGMVFPDAYVILKDGDGKVLEETRDIFKDETNGLNAEEVKKGIDLSYGFAGFSPGKKYSLEFGFKDKRGTGSLASVISFTW